MKKIRVSILAATLTFSIASVADAHPQLKEATPAPGSSVTISPKALQIEFSEGIVPAFSGVQITNGKGEKQLTGKASVDPKNNKQLIVPLESQLRPGKYTVVWHAVGDDTHKTNGKYSFDIRP